MASNLSGVTTSSGVGLNESNLQDIAKAVQPLADLNSHIKPDIGGQTEFDDMKAPITQYNPFDHITGRTEQFDNPLPDTTEADTEKWNQIQDIKQAGAILKATGGIINAQSKYKQITNQNTFNMHMAEIQEAQVMSSSAFAQLREQTKGKARAGSARIAAVGQGQDANGDLANTASSAEEVYAAQNMMNMQINTMRQIFGIQSQERMYQYQNQLAKISRDEEIFHSVLSGVQSVAGAQSMKRTPAETPSMSDIRDTQLGVDL